MSSSHKKLKIAVTTPPTPPWPACLCLPWTPWTEIHCHKILFEICQPGIKTNGVPDIKKKMLYENMPARLREHIGQVLKNYGSNICRPSFQEKVVIKNVIKPIIGWSVYQHGVRVRTTWCSTCTGS